MFPSIRRRWPLRALLFAGGLAAVAGTCDGGGGPSSPPPADAQNPCAAAALEAGDAVQTRRNAAQTAAKQAAVDSSGHYRHLTEIWNHRSAQAARTSIEALDARVGPTAVTRDVGEIAVIQDNGDLMLPLNPFDLRGTGLRFTRQRRRLHVRGSTARSAPRSATADARRRRQRRRRTIPFAFQFYGTAQTVAFVNSDGNITFEEEDAASTERNLGRLVTGPPRIAPVLRRPRSHRQGGSVFVQCRRRSVHGDLVRCPRLRLDRA